MEIYSNELLDNYKSQSPYFQHPYDYLKKSFYIIDKKIDIFKNNTLFNDKIESNRNSINDLISFYTLISEIKVALYLNEKCTTFDFYEDGNNRSPDFYTDKIYVEVNTPLKSMPSYIIQITRKLNEFIKNKKIRFGYYSFNPLPIINNKDDAIKIYNEAKKNIGKNKLSYYPAMIYADETKRVKIFIDNEISDFDRVCGTGLRTFQTILFESLKSKIEIEKDDYGKKLKKINNKYELKNNLNQKHPNILWSELCFLQDFQISLTEIEDDFWESYGLPENLDCQIISISGLTDLYDKNRREHLLDFIPKFIILVNENSEYALQIMSFLKQIFPDKRKYYLNKTAEELQILSLK